MSKDSIGILLQGGVNDSSEKVVKAYQENFPDAEILFSTWKTENVKNISCNVLQLEEPKPVPLSHVCVNNWAAEEFSKYISSKDISQNHINHQIKGSLYGLKKMDADIIMKCRTDQVIQNKHIFQLYEKALSKNKIMITNLATFEDINYWASDICQISTRETLLDYWNSIEYFDGTCPPAVEIYLTTNYILRGKKDLSPWKEVLRKYFYVKDFVKDFQIGQWMKFTPEWNIWWFYNRFYNYLKKPDL